MNAPQTDWTVPPDPAEIEQLREVAKLPLSEKLKWLAGAQRLVENLQRSREQREQHRGERKLEHE